MTNDYIIKEEVIDKFVHNLNSHYKSREARQHLCNCVKPIRKKYGITQRRLAELAGIGSNTLFRAEQGVRPATAQTIARIYYALYVELGKMHLCNIGSTF